jgi:hypothetical protein
MEDYSHSPIVVFNYLNRLSDLIVYINQIATEGCQLNLSPAKKLNLYNVHKTYRYRPAFNGSIIVVFGEQILADGSKTNKYPVCFETPFGSLYPFPFHQVRKLDRYTLVKEDFDLLYCILKKELNLQMIAQYSDSTVTFVQKDIYTKEKIKEPQRHNDFKDRNQHLGANNEEWKRILRIYNNACQTLRCVGGVRFSS